MRDESKKRTKKSSPPDPVWNPPPAYQKHKTRKKNDPLTSQAAKTKHFHLGRAAELAIMSELTLRGYVVATPGIDTGVDVFAIHPESGKMTKIQVKSITKQRVTKSGVKYLVSIQIKQLQEADSSLFYALMFRDSGKWVTLLIPQTELIRLRAEHKIGTPNRQGRLNVNFWIAEHEGRAKVITFGKLPGGKKASKKGREIVLSKYVSNFSPWPSWTGYE